MEERCSFACSAVFFLLSRITCLGVVCFPVGWAPSHSSLIKKMPTSLPTGHSDGVEPFSQLKSPSSQMPLVYVKLMPCETNKRKKERNKTKQGNPTWQPAQLPLHPGYLTVDFTPEKTKPEQHNTQICDLVKSQSSADLSCRDP